MQLTNDDSARWPEVLARRNTMRYSTERSNSGEPTMDTWVVPVLGGQPRRLLTNAEGLTWFNAVSEPSAAVLRVDRPRLSDVDRHFDGKPRRAQRLCRHGPAWRTVRISRRDRKWVLSSRWTRPGCPAASCRSTAVHLESPSARRRRSARTPHGRQTGSGCISQSTPADGVHTWRQRFPDGTTEQVTFGVTEEEGIHFAPDGRSFVTSIGTSQSTVWMHDARGDTADDIGGLRFSAVDSPGRQEAVLPGAWRQHGELHRRQAVGRGLRTRASDSGCCRNSGLQSYNISADGQRVVFVAKKTVRLRCGWRR